jgi:hypothetical protein
MKIYNFKKTKPDEYERPGGVSKYNAKNSDLFNYIDQILPTGQTLGYVEQHVK